MSFIKKVYRSWATNPLDKILIKAQKKKHKKFLLFWNRGLGDIALGLYPIVWKIKKKIPTAEITFYIRQDLAEGFRLLEGIKFVSFPEWKRGVRYKRSQVLINESFDIIIDWPDPSYWVQDLYGKLIPKLLWKKEFEKSLDHLGIDLQEKYIAIQPLCETDYGHWRNLPITSMQKLISKLLYKGEKILLLGKENNPISSHKNLYDLRGKTDLHTLLTLIQKTVKTLVVPDSGILSLTYYLDLSFPIKIISFWADPNHGVLKQKVFSPNPELQHIPLIAENKDLSTLSIKRLYETIRD